jgi:hypothetical protein
MNNVEWLVFSYTLPARSSGGRMKVWRRLAALGAIQLKNALYVLPATEANVEHLVWTVREVVDLGGEAVYFQTPSVGNVSDGEVEALFAQARDQDYDGLEDEIRAFAAVCPPPAPGASERERRTALRKFARRLAAIREIDFFPTGRGDRAAMLLDSLEAAGDAAGPGPGVLDRDDYRGRVWVTRERPYIDRLASFWLVRRFLDPDAPLEFVPAGHRFAPDDGRVRFDMASGGFTHKDGRITFEVMAVAFGLMAGGMVRLAGLVRAIDLKEEEGHEDARAIRDVIDGLVLTARDDHDLMDKGFVLFDALYAAYGRK